MFRRKKEIKTDLSKGEANMQESLPVKEISSKIALQLEAMKALAGEAVSGITRLSPGVKIMALGALLAVCVVAESSGLNQSSGSPPAKTSGKSAQPRSEILSGTYVRQGTTGLLSLTFSGNNVTLVTSGFKNMGMTVKDRTVQGTYTRTGNTLTFNWEEWQGQGIIIHTGRYSLKGNVLTYDGLRYVKK